MLVFQVSSRGVQLVAPPRKRTRFLPYQQYIITRVIGALLYASLLFALFALTSFSMVRRSTSCSRSA